MMKMLVKADKNPVVKFQPNVMTVDATATATAYAIQPNGTLSPLFVLNVVSQRARKEKKLAMSEFPQYYLSAKNLSRALDLMVFRHRFSSDDKNLGDL